MPVMQAPFLSKQARSENKNVPRAVARLQNKRRQDSSADGARRYGGVGACPPPPLENLEIYRLINALVSISHGIFLQKSQFWVSVEVHFLIA